jgi:hypothetical protein
MPGSSAGHRRRLAAACAGAALLVAACASIPPERCASVDWREQGVDDGRAGFGPARLQRHREACAAVGVVPDAAAWEDGRAAGLVEYCRLPNAIRQGLARHAYDGVCADPRFEQAWAAARRFGDARYRVEHIDGQIDWRERELLTNSKLGEDKRADYVAEVRSLGRERERAIAEREDAARSLDRLRRQLGI